MSFHTARAYAGDLAIFEAHLGPDRVVDDIYAESVLAFVVAQRLSGLVGASVRRRASAIRGFCRWLLDRRYLLIDPWEKLSLDLPPPRRLPRALPSSEAVALVQYLR